VIEYIGDIINQRDLLMSTTEKLNYARDALLQELSAMENSQQWDSHVKEKNKDFSGVIDVQKSEQMADYLTDAFIKACNKNNVFGKFIGWADKDVIYKTEIASTVIDNVLDIIRGDIKSGNITIYTASGEKYTPLNRVTDELFKHNIATNVNIKVVSADNSLIHNKGLMGVDSTGKLFINFDFPLYGMPECFLTDLRHEMMHIVDMFFPNISALPPEINVLANRYYYPQDKDFYNNNPLELNAEMKRSDYAKKIQQMLAEQQACISKQMNAVRE
jgi:hypothetical protein